MRFQVLAAAVVAVALTGLAAEAAPQRSETNWTARPTATDFAPLQARLREHGGGRAVMQCAVADDGALGRCRLTLEQPSGTGFGAALLALAPKYRRQPPGKTGLRTVNVTYDWHPIDTAPDWLHKPDENDLRAVFPRDAYKRGIGGKALISCVATTQGGLRDCVVLEESPADAGFGGAAIALTPQFTMKPAKLKGQAVVSTVNIPINWPAMSAPGDTFGSKKVAPTDLAWAEAPSFADVAAAYPRKARAEKVGGRATVACDMNEEGRLYGCNGVTSEPRGYGFDTAAKALAKRFRFPVADDKERELTHSLTVHLPIVFDPGLLTGAEPQVGKPKWAALPSSEQVVAAFKDLKVGGTARVVLGCTVQPGGAVGGCTVVSEDPAATGLGAAAMTLVPAFKLTTWTSEGLPIVGGQVRIPLRYEGDATQAAGK